MAARKKQQQPTVPILPYTIGEYYGENNEIDGQYWMQIPKDVYELEEGKLHKYAPMAKTVCGRVWSQITPRAWTDHNGKEHQAAYFKLFLWSGEEKYRCECRFEQATECFEKLKKGDWVVVFGLDDLVEAVKSKKRYHNFRVVKLWIMPEGYGMLDWREIFQTIKHLVRGYTEAIERIEELERLCGIEERLPTPRGDKEQPKKRQSLAPIVGDIYKDIQEGGQQDGSDYDDDDE